MTFKCVYVLSTLHGHLRSVTNTSINPDTLIFLALTVLNLKKGVKKQPPDVTTAKVHITITKT